MKKKFTTFVAMFGSFALLWLVNCQPMPWSGDEWNTATDGASRSDDSTPKVDAPPNQDGLAATEQLATQDKTPNQERRYEEEPCVDGATIPCYTGPEDTRYVGPCKDGLTVCMNGVWTPCTNQVLPQKEECNGKDDDCDGTIDEVTTPKPCNPP